MCGRIGLGTEASNLFTGSVKPCVRARAQNLNEESDINRECMLAAIFIDRDY